MLASIVCSCNLSIIFMRVIGTKGAMVVENVFVLSRHDSKVCMGYY